MSASNPLLLKLMSANFFKPVLIDYQPPCFKTKEIIQ